MRCLQQLRLLTLILATTVGTSEAFAARNGHRLLIPTMLKGGAFDKGLRMSEGGEDAGDGAHKVKPVYDAKANSAFDKYLKTHKESVTDPSGFWGKVAKETLTWTVPFDEDRVVQGDFEKGDVRWFEGGKMNVAYNALDRHDPEALAMIWEGDEPDDIRRITFGELTNKVSQIANALQSQGVKKGDVVTIYMP